MADTVSDLDAVVGRVRVYLAANADASQWRTVDEALDCDEVLFFGDLRTLLAALAEANTTIFDLREELGEVVTLCQVAETTALSWAERNEATAIALAEARECEAHAAEDARKFGLEAARLRDVLGRYGKHLDDCDVNDPWATKPCNCGLSRALEES